MTVQGYTSAATTKVQRSYPSCTVTIYHAVNPSANISSAARAASVATITTNTAHNFASGSSVIIAGVIDATFNGAQTITGATEYTFTYANAGANTTSSGGTATLSGLNYAPIYADDSGTPKANPFTAAAEGSWFFYASDGRYDVRLSAGGIPTPFTRGDHQAFEYEVIRPEAGATRRAIRSKLTDTASIRDFGGTCVGAGNDNVALQAAAALSNTTVRFPPGVCVATADVTFPASVTLDFDGGAGIQANAGVTVTIAGPVKAGEHQVFSGTGSFALTGTAAVHVAWFGGANIGAQTNAAVTAACNGVPCRLLLPQGKSLSYSTTITLPDEYVDLDLGGSILTYTGAGNAILVPTSNEDYKFISGRIHNGEILGNAGANAVGIRQQSRIGMVYENLRIANFTGATGACMQWENTVGAGPGTVQFNEQNAIKKADFENCTKGLRWNVNGGTNSFAYNSVRDVHFGVNDGQIGFSLEGTGAAQSLFANGGVYELRFNLNTAAVPGIAISLTNGADWERAFVTINGEKTSGAAASIGLSRDAASVFNNFGSFYVDNTTNTANPGVQILQPQGFHDSTAPVNTYVSDFNGPVRFRGDPVFGVDKSAHWTYPLANSDESFIVLVGAGATSADFTFTKQWNSVPNCTVTPNTLVLGPGGVGVGSWYITPAVDKLTVGISDAQGGPVTFFAHCKGNPN